jgi:UPF0176 protein
MIIAEEGINATLEGLTEDIERYVEHMKLDERFSDVFFKFSPGTGRAFPKLSIKVRPEIVSSYWGKHIKPQEKTGKYLDPDKLREWYQHREDFVVVDMRNDYEVESGKFENAVHPGMRNFRDLERDLKNIEDLKEKKVVAVCTAGVRCEKASAYLMEKGFKDVYQLHGGIHTYLEKFPGQNFKGTLYTFDNRITMQTASENERDIIGKCRFCGSPSEKYVNCENSDCHLHFIICESCEKDRIFCSEECLATAQK